MRRLVLVLLATLASACTNAGAQAGVYLPAEGPLALSRDSRVDRVRQLSELREFLKKLGIQRTEEELAKIEGSELQQVHTKYLQHIALLEHKQKESKLTIEDRVNLSGYYLRMYTPLSPERARLAVRVLTLDADVGDRGVKPIDEHNFMLLANLATALLLRDGANEDSLRAASEFQQDVLDNWPSVSLDYPAVELNWSFRAERLFLKLLRVRLNEARLKKNQDSPDELFPVLQRAWKTGYTAGILRSHDAAEIPADALEALVQMVLWLPHDARLYWLVAELENALNGDFLRAEDIMMELKANDKYRPVLMADHMLVLEQAKQWQATWFFESSRVQESALYFSQGIAVGDEKDPQVAPLTMLPLPQGAAPMLQAVGLVVAMNAANRSPGDRSRPPAPPPPDSTSTPGPATSKWAPDWKTGLVSFAAGALVSMLLIQQWRQFQLRRLLRATAAAHVSEDG